MSLNWYAVRTKAQSEYLAAQVLGGQGFEVFLPLVGSPKPRAGREDTPLFPGYLFLRYDVEHQDWPSLTVLPGILGWVRFNGVVPAVPDEIVELIAERVQAINCTGGLWTRFRRGQRVQVVSGKMEGLAEVVEEPRSPEDRVKVLLEFMGRQVPARVPWLSLRPIERTALAPHSGANQRRTRGRGRRIREAGAKTPAIA